MSKITIEAINTTDGQRFMIVRHFGKEAQPLANYRPLWKTRKGAEKFAREHYNY